MKSQIGNQNSPVLRIHYATCVLDPFKKISYTYCDAYWEMALSRLHIMLQQQLLFINEFIKQS